MRKILLLSAVAGLAALVIHAGSDWSPLQAQARVEARVALTGRVVSDEEGPMEGVVVTAREEGSAISISVVTDDKGRYSFPERKLQSGDYLLKIRATGYELLGPAAIDVRSGVTASADLRLKPATNLAAQLTNAEWLASMPGSDQQKKFLLSCNSCHSYQPIVNSTHDASQFLQVFDRMAGYYPGSTLQHPQRLVGTARRNLGGGAGNAMGGEGGMSADPRAKAAAEWLATVNLSKGPTRDYLLKALPRPSGRATRVVVTEYDLPRRAIEPHDVIVDRDGMVWYSDFGAPFLGRMDPKTGKVTEYPIPLLKEGFPVGTLDLEADRDGNLWVGLMYQGGVARLDRTTGKVQTWSVPKEWQTDATQQSFASPTFSHVDGKVWVKNSDRAQILRLDPATGAWENFGTFTDPETKRTIGSYGINADQNNNLYLLDFNAGGIGLLDGATKKLEVVHTKIPNSRPRRGSVDARNRLWFGEYDGNAIAMLDPKTKQIAEWPVPTPWSNPYDVVVDRNGEAWTGSMMSDRIVRLDTKTGRFTEYLLPNPTNIRRVWVDNSTNPVTFWVGSNHGASIVKVEPLD
ncbi:MAG: carboxypeptidase regulatory-like domain-containing protein [Acidobacteria bacterium]|nr:carboxypeptidase regulatory-like domain-containing protein [Acidobacteriota bacterium]